MSASPAQNQVSQFAVYGIRFPVDGGARHQLERMREVITDRFGPDSFVRFDFGVTKEGPCVSSKRVRGGDGEDYWRHEARVAVLTDLDAHALMSDVDGAIVEKASSYGLPELGD